MELSLRDVMDTSFAMLLASWKVDQALRFLKGLDYSHIIVCQVREETRHYLYSKHEAQRLLTRGRGDQSIGEVFELDGGRPAEAFEDITPADHVPDLAVALDQGRVAGFFDVTEIGFEATRLAVKPSKTLEAYPSLEAPRQVKPGVEFELHVGFRDSLDSDVTTKGKLIFDDVQEGEQCLVVLVADGLKVDRTFQSLPLILDAQVSFRCTALACQGTFTLQAQYFFRNQLIGIGSRILSISDEAVELPPTAEPLANPSGIQLPESDSLIDITITVNHFRDNRLQWSWTAPQPGIQTTDPHFTELVDSIQFAADLVRELKTQDYTGVYAANILENRGQAVADLIPIELLADLELVHQAIGRVPTLLLMTNETFVPWELATVPWSFDPKAPQFLGAQTCMGRWLSDQGVAHPPAKVVEILELTAVAAEYTSASRKVPLPEAIAERANLAKRWNFAQLEADPNELEPYVVGSYKAGRLMHFAIHGLSDPQANNQVLILKDGRQLPASALAGRRNSKGSPRFAFVFLNACQVGMAGSDFGQAAGFPGLLIRSGVHGFIAPLWVVDDRIAREIAERFYQATLGDHESVGLALQTQRAQYDPKASTTTLAYVYYGNPALKLQTKATSPEERATNA